MMRKLNTTIVSLIATLALTSITCSANPIIPIPSQAQPIIKPALPSIEAKGYILMDAKSGQILAEKNADARMAPASLTKLMSLYIISGALRSGSVHLEDKVRISTKAWKTGGSRMFVKVNDEVPLKDLMQGIAIASGNDASVAMAEYIAGTEETFAEMMNSQAKVLGMNDSHFMDSTGLPNPQHYSTPRDFAKLAQALTRDFPEDYKLFSEKWFTYNNIRQPNRNRLLWRFQYADGLKTGHTDDAGYCLVASAQKDGMRLISVIMGAPSDNARTEDSIRLLTYGFRFFETHKIVDGGKSLTEARVWKGTQKEVSLGLDQDWYATLPTGAYKNIQKVYVLNEPLNAPIVKGESYGNLNLVVNNQVLVSKPLIALKDDPKGGMFRSIGDAMRFRFQKIFSKSAEKVNNG
ncbi:MAG: D-alanyl-D-alanine carboxypeptidase [Gammaproteobacteria bacterium]|nr:D-alanyl-D-alanine carboxypeptidase [Gammaproteobacteria bacterium]